MDPAGRHLPENHASLRIPREGAFGAGRRERVDAGRLARRAHGTPQRYRRHLKSSATIFFPSHPACPMPASQARPTSDQFRAIHQG